MTFSTWPSHDLDAPTLLVPDSESRDVCTALFTGRFRQEF